MSSIYDRRWANAKRIWTKFMMLHKAGYVIFDQENEIVEGFRLNEEGCYTTFNRDGTGGGTFYFLNDPQLDNGMMTKVQDWNNQFLQWKCIHPLDMKSMREYLR
jgi:hypothetical protein